MAEGHYYVRTRKDRNGYYEVHNSECYKLPAAKNREYLGCFDDCAEAILKAENLGWEPADGCAHCSPDCHFG